MNELMFDGIITYRWPIEKVWDKWAVKRTIWVSEDENKAQYPKSISFDLFQDKVDIYWENDRKIWDDVRVRLNSKYRIYKNKDWVDRCYNSLTLRKMSMNHEGIKHMDKWETFSKIKESLEDTKKRNQKIIDDDLPF